MARFRQVARAVAAAPAEPSSKGKKGKKLTADARKKLITALQNDLRAISIESEKWQETPADQDIAGICSRFL
jgi:hypothetical protein